MSFSTLRSVDDRFKRTVFYYIHEIEKKHKTLKVPVAIKHLCLNYYLIQECFEGYPKTETIITNESTDSYEYMDVVGNDQIIDLADTSITKYKWMFQLLSIPTGFTHEDSESAPGLFIGLKSTEKFPPPKHRSWDRELKYKFRYVDIAIGSGYWCPRGCGSDYEPEVGHHIMMEFDAKKRRCNFIPHVYMRMKERLDMMIILVMEHLEWQCVYLETHQLNLYHLKLYKQKMRTIDNHYHYNYINFDQLLKLSMCEITRVVPTT